MSTETSSGVVFKCGARSNDKALRYDQIPTNALRRLAARFTKGHAEHDGPGAEVMGGQMNWQQGDKEFFTERYNHLVEHLTTWKECRETGEAPTEDDLAAAMWGCVVLMWAEERGII